MIYPPDLARYIEAEWPKEVPLRVSRGSLDHALGTAFQASMTLEEGRATRFRLLLTPAEELPESGSPTSGVLRLKFAHSRPLRADELRRLSPAVAFETALIGAQEEKTDGLRIWGVAHSGPAWLAPTWGGRSLVPNWTLDPIIHVMGPGRLAVRCAGKLIGALERGAILAATIDVFDSEWLPAMFVREREAVRTKHAALQAASNASTTVEDSLVGRISQHMLRRAIQLVRGARHGGMILVKGTAGDERGLRLKYRFAQDEPTHRYRTLLLSLVAEVARGASSKLSVGWSDFEADRGLELERLERAVFETSRVIANFAAIDGAVVLDRDFGVVGFGAEVSAELSTPSMVWRALDSEGHAREPDAVENVGTRHRAAYRFVCDHADGLAIVVSHDGGVSFVANRGGDVVFWEQSIGP